MKAEQSIIMNLSQKISQEQIHCPDEDTASLLESIVCPVCLMLLPMPHYTCEQCDNKFCSKCIDDWWTKNGDQTCIFKCSKPSFKTVKRDNTYNALMKVLKTKCDFCKQLVVLADRQNHSIICPKWPVQCQFNNCQNKFQRDHIKQHQQECQYRQLACQHCKISIQATDLENHLNKECQVYEYRKSKCKWCQQIVLKCDFQNHKESCSKMRVECQLCMQQINKSEIEKHKIECMFISMVKLKQENKFIKNQNQMLWDKVQQLQQKIIQGKKNRQIQTIEALDQLKRQQKIETQKDILRLKNGIQSIQSFRKRQMDEHLKSPHFSTKLCPFCISMRKKREDDLEPLLKQMQTVTKKLKSIQNEEYNSKQSIVRLSKILE